MDPTQQQQGQQPVTIDAVMQLLRDDKMRGFRIDVETDSMIEADQSAEKASRTEFVTAVGGFLTQLGPVVKEMPPLAPLVAGMLQFAVKGYKVGQELEELIDKTMQNVLQVLQNPTPPQPSPDEVIKHQTAQVKGQSEAAKAQSNIQATQMKAQAEGQKAQVGVQQAQVDAAGKAEAQKIEIAGKVLDHHHAVAEHHMKAEQMQRQAVADERAHKLKIEQMEHAAKQAKQKPKGDK